MALHYRTLLKIDTRKFYARLGDIIRETVKHFSISTFVNGLVSFYAVPVIRYSMSCELKSLTKAMSVTR